MSSLKIIHVLRAPVGGLFRHVVDLARGQVARGHQVGLVADSTTGAARAEATLAELSPTLALGLTRIAMSRHLGLTDLAAAHAVAHTVDLRGADVVHGHGAKGGAYARLTDGRRAVRVYTPHGGSLHYRKYTPLGLVYLNLERILMRRTELFLFESAYGADIFAKSVGRIGSLSEVVHNGVAEAEFTPVTPAPDATDLLFVGELRTLKGVDVLIEAIRLLAREGRRLTATIVGDGPDAAAFRARATELGLNDAIRFPGALPARTAFALGRLLVVPSRAESLPYIILEAAAAGLPLIATRVGGIAEILGPAADRLVAADDAAALAQAILAARDDPDGALRGADQLRQRVKSAFSVDHMTESVLAAYATALAKRTEFLRSD